MAEFVGVSLSTGSPYARVTVCYCDRTTPDPIHYGQCCLLRVTLWRDLWKIWALFNVTTLRNAHKSHCTGDLIQWAGRWTMWQPSGLTSALNPARFISLSRCRHRYCPAGGRSLVILVSHLFLVLYALPYTMTLVGMHSPLHDLVTLVRSSGRAAAEGFTFTGDAMFLTLV